MRLIVRAFGLDLLDIELTTETAEYEDEGSALNGGYLGSDRIEAGPTDRYLGFTNGRESDD